MTKKTHEQVVILSAQRDDLSNDLNNRLNLILDDMLYDLNISYKRAKGVYKGGIDDCFVVVVNNQDEIETLMNYAFINFNQESIFHQDVNGLCRLIHRCGKTETIGKLRTVNPKYEEQLENYVLMDNTIYTTERV